MKKELPFTSQQLKRIIEKFPTPFHIYDEKAIKQNAQNLKKVFSWNSGFKEFFAVKATPNPFIMKILKTAGFGSDSSSMAELVLSEKIGITGEEIMFSSNDTPAEEYQKARDLGAIINLDDIRHIDFLEKNCGIPQLISFRYNPGPLRTGNAIIGEPVEAKYGFTKEQLFEGYKLVREKGAERFGLHTMIISNELNPQSFIDTAILLFNLVVELYKELNIRIEFINLGGGIGIPYHPDQQDVNLNFVSEGIHQAYDQIIRVNQLHPVKIYMECGRMITGPYGYLVSSVLHIKETYKHYVGLDASMANLMRPGMYGSYHHITILDKTDDPCEYTYDVTGSLCENNDKFAIDRKLPKIEKGDIIIIHDTGAHGHAMGFNYNGKLRSAELLLRENGEAVQIRRAETLNDLFSTLDFEALERFTV